MMGTGILDGLVFLDGLVYGSWLFLVASGLALIYGVQRILNVAHGGFFATGAYMGAWLAKVAVETTGNGYVSYAGLVLGAVLAAVAVGPMTEWGVLRRLYGREELAVLLGTFAILLILEDVTKLLWGVQAYSVDEPYRMLGSVPISGGAYPRYAFALVGVAVLAGVALWWFSERTRFGKLVRAVVADREISAAMGVNVRRLQSWTFVVGVLLAALGGALTAPMSAVEPGIGIEVIIVGFAVVAIGGLGSIAGAAVGCVIVGVVRAVSVRIFPEFDVFVVYALMALVLVVRPQGLLGVSEGRTL